MFKFKLGETLKDKITGFEGVVMGRTNYFTGCDHYGLCAKTLIDGKPLEWQWFDETRLICVEEESRVFPEGRKTTSGPHPNAPQQ